MGFSDGANIAMKFAIKYPNSVRALILNGGEFEPAKGKNNNAAAHQNRLQNSGTVRSQIARGKKNAEMLGLMVNDPNMERRELSKITALTLVICGKNNIIRQSHTREIAQNITGREIIHYI